METLFFSIAKLVGFALKVETWLLLALVLAWLALVRGYQRQAHALLSALIGCLLTIAILPLGEWLLAPLEADYPPRAIPAQVDGIVILGGSEDTSTTRHWGQAQLNEAAERLTAGAVLARHYPNARIVFSGGSGRLRDLLPGHAALADVSGELLSSLGVAPSRLVWEQQSRNTAENARYSLQLAQPKAAEQWILVTSAFHMGRAMHSFHQAGWTNLSPYPVDYRSKAFRDGIGWNLGNNLDTLNTAIKEWIGRVVYRLSSR